MNIPVLSAYQTLENAQGTLDPLGLYTIADRLALRLAPGLRERMKHPRYLTAIAVGSVICSRFDEDELASDELSPPWQVYEWLVASALVKRFEKDNNQLLGLPGREKTTKAMRDKVPLSVDRYLKTASVYGFHGVYKTFAKQIKLTNENHLGELGSRLIDTWESEQQLNGFAHKVSNSPGAYFRNKLENAVREGLLAGRVPVSWNWGTYDQLAETLAPKSPGVQEADVIFNAFSSSDSPHRAELISFILSSKGQQALETDSEKMVHAEFLKTANHCRPLLLAIRQYERIARRLYNAFYEMLLYMDRHQQRGNLNQFTTLNNVRAAWEGLPALFEEAEQLIASFPEEAVMFNKAFQTLREPASLKDWIESLLIHHYNVQKSKPPNGKATWILESEIGDYLLNTTVDSEMELSDEYVHQYRTFSIKSFLKDLRRIS